MIAQVQNNYGLRNRTVNDKLEKSSGIFIKDTTLQKVIKEQEPLVLKVKDQKIQNWEAKKDVPIAKVERKEEPHLVKTVILKMDKVIRDSSLQALVNKGINLDLKLCAPIDMFTMLSQMAVKVPLL